MKKTVSALFVIIAAFAAAQATSRAANGLSPAAQTASEPGKAVREKPKESWGDNARALTLVRRAQETLDVRLYAEAEEAVKKSLKLVPNDFETEKIEVSILLGEHEYPQALEASEALNKRVPDDVMVYGLLTDANVELGNYKDAETAAQWMLNLRPGNLPALTRAAHLRELFGDPEGAYELFEMALQSTAPTDAGGRAAILAQMGHLRLASGSTDGAEKLLEQALKSSANYSPALGNLAQVRLTQKRYAEAMSLLQQRYQSVPNAENLYDLAEALQLGGREEEAKKAFGDFESKALLETNRKDNSNRQLIFYYADKVQQPAKALKLAQQEYAWRHDIYTLDAYAWALHVNGQNAEARKQIESALAVGIRDATLFHHAGEIALKMGDIPAAEHYLKDSVALNATDSEQARMTLASLSQAGQR